MEKVFVYGTLRKPRVGHDPRLTGNFAAIERFVTKTEPATMFGAVMIDLGSFPAITPGAGIIKGEIHTVMDEGVTVMDRIEGHPNFYRRKLVHVTITGGKTVVAWTYWGPKRAWEKSIKSGDWLNQD